MFGRLFPKQFDNAYQGHKIAIWIFVLVLLLRAAQAIAVLVDTRQTLLTADAVPLDSFGPGGSETVIFYAAILAFSGLVIPLQSIVVLIRYRAMIPFMYLCMLVLSLGNRLLASLHPAPRAEVESIVEHAREGFYVPNSGYYVGLIILAMMIVGFVLSIIPPRTPKPAVA